MLYQWAYKLYLASWYDFIFPILSGYALLVDVPRDKNITGKFTAISFELTIFFYLVAKTFKRTHKSWLVIFPVIFLMNRSAI